MQGSLHKLALASSPCLAPPPARARPSTDVQGNRLRGLAEWVDCPKLCLELTQAENNAKSQQLATMSWGVRFSCRVCQVCKDLNTKTEKPQGRPCNLRSLSLACGVMLS